MSTKENPGAEDCYRKALPDEPMFILLARDRNAPSLIQAWIDERLLQVADKHLTSTPELVRQLASAENLIQEIQEWRDVIYGEEQAKTLSGEPIVILIDKDGNCPSLVQGQSRYRLAWIDDKFLQIASAESLAKAMQAWRNANYGRWWNKDQKEPRIMEATPPPAPQEKESESVPD